MDDNAPWVIHTWMNLPEPEVGVELKLMATVTYRGTKNAIPPNSTVLFVWCREDIPTPWSVAGSSATYVPTNEDLGHRLKLIAFAVDDYGIRMTDILQVITAPVRTSVRPHRSLITFTKTHLEVKTNSSGFRILSYNILADMYVQTGRDRYPHCPPHQLSWDYRKCNLLFEILSYEADVLCLQEVQSDHFSNYFQPQLARFGYSAVYKQKMDGGISDGCASFFRRDKFKLIKDYKVEYEKMAKFVTNRLRNDLLDEATSRLVKDNIANVVILEEIGDYQSMICVANTHLNSGKGVSDVRLFQVLSLIRGLQKIDSLDIPIIVCGDMNSTIRSDTHDFVTKGKINHFMQEQRDVLGLSKILKLKHSMHLANAYAYSGVLHQNDTLDYIFYTEDKLKVDGVLEFPFYETVGMKRQLPTPQWSSDHVSLVANLRIRKSYRKKNYSDLPTDPWDDIFHNVGVSEKVKNSCLQVGKKQTFKKKKKKIIFYVKNYGSNIISTLDKRAKKKTIHVKNDATNMSNMDKKARKKAIHVKNCVSNIGILDRLLLETLQMTCSKDPHVHQLDRDSNNINHYLMCS